jgi:uncharacterized coiled-coil protein SlyX
MDKNKDISQPQDTQGLQGLQELQETINKMESFLVELQRKFQETRDNLLFLKGKLEGLKESKDNANGTTKKSI